MSQGKTHLVEGTIRRGASIVRQVFDMLDGADCFIAGGFARYACSPHRTPVAADDIDIYCITADAFGQAKHALIKAGLTLTKNTTASLSFRDTRPRWRRKLCDVVQLVKPINLGEIALFGSVETVLSGSDLSVLQVAIINPSTVLQYSSFEEDELRRQVTINSIPCPVMAIYRLCKYSEKGYHIPAAELIKIFEAWDAKTPEYKTTLRDLIGEKGKVAGFKELMLLRLQHPDGERKIESGPAP
jgi:hypothetical protein